MKILNPPCSGAFLKPVLVAICLKPEAKYFRIKKMLSKNVQNWDHVINKRETSFVLLFVFKV